MMEAASSQEDAACVCLFPVAGDAVRRHGLAVGDRVMRAFLAALVVPGWDGCGLARALFVRFHQTTPRIQRIRP